MIALCKSRVCPALFFRGRREARRALSTLCVKNATEQQESAPEAPVNASIAEMQYRAEMSDKCKTQKKENVKLIGHFYTYVVLILHWRIFCWLYAYNFFARFIYEIYDCRRAFRSGNLWFCANIKAYEKFFYVICKSGALNVNLTLECAYSVCYTKNIFLV